MNTLGERSLTDDEINDLRSDIDEGRKMLGVTGPNQTPELVATAIDEYVRNYANVGKDQEFNELACLLGCIWGEVIHLAAEWEWGVATLKAENLEKYAVFSPNRDYCILPTLILGQQLRLTGSTLMLTFNSVLQGDLPPVRSGQRTPLW